LKNFAAVRSIRVENISLAVYGALGLAGTTRGVKNESGFALIKLWKLWASPRDAQVGQKLHAWPACGLLVRLLTVARNQNNLFEGRQLSSVNVCQSLELYKGDPCSAIVEYCFLI
jgi:hypothetical protein